MGSGKRSLPRDDEDTLTAEPLQKQLKIDTAISGQFVTQDRVNKLVANFIIQGLHSFRTVERPEFQELIKGLQPGKTVLARKTLVKKIDTEASAFKKHLKEIIMKVPYVSTTADCWKSFNRSYIGVTIHWIDFDTLERRTAVLACRRMHGHHTYDQIANILQSINKEYAIQNKIIGTTTDNGSNFVKAFRMFSNVNSTEQNDDDDFEFIELTPILDTGSDEGIINLPNHERCAAHTLNLIATTDARKAENNSHYKKAMRKALARCQALWNKQNTSSLNADLIHEKLGIYLVTPNETRWNSLFNSISCLTIILKHKQDTLMEVLDNLGLPRFQQDDIKFMDEYCKIMKPVSTALDTLQGEHKAFMGLLLPVLHALRRRLVNLKTTTNATTCHPLIEALIEGLDHRFNSQWFRKDLVLAAVLHPEYQFNWIKDDPKVGIAKNWLKDMCLVSQDPDSVCNTQIHQKEEQDEDDVLFDFKKPSANNKDRPAALIELDHYTAFSSGELSSLHTLPTLKKYFIHYNTAIPSSAAVERIFSVGGDIFTRKRGRLSDENFENILMIKIGIK